MYDVFNHQLFLLREPPSDDYPLGRRVRRSYRDIMTGADEALRFDYPSEHFNVAALGLCSALTQVAFEPMSTDQLAQRLDERMSGSEFDEAVGELINVFSIDGSTRFLQGAPPERDKKGRYVGLEPLADRLSLTASSFMNRPDTRWVVSPEQIPLLLFDRCTFYEKSAGRGYLTGTSGDLEIRTFPIDSTSLRKTIWLNVLSRETQQRNPGYFGEPDAAGVYDDWMWRTPPVFAGNEVPRNKITLRSALLWMVAYNHIIIEEIDTPSPCMVTGEMVSGRVGTAVYTRSTGIGYGGKIQREKGPAVRDSFFLHPSGPYKIWNRDGSTPSPGHLAVDELSGLIGQMGGLFFSSSRSTSRRIAPAVEQLYSLRDSVDELPQLDLHCFGFHMLSSKKNIHGGYETELFRYPLLGREGENVEDILTAAESLMQSCAEIAETTRSLMTRCIQMILMVEANAEVKRTGGRDQLTFKPMTVAEKGFVVDLAREYWHNLSKDLRDLLKRVATNGASYEELTGAQQEIQSWWRSQAAAHARRIFLRFFNDVTNASSSLPQLIAAHNANRLFYGTLRKNGVDFGRPAPSPNTPATPTTEVA